jgi:hypothetical protein
LAWLVLAFGGAMSIGTLMAMLRPPEGAPGPRPATRAAARPGQPRPGRPRPGQARPASAGAKQGAAAKSDATRPAPARQVPLARSIVFITVGGLAALWALASLLSS